MYYPTKWWTYHLVQKYNPINVELENLNEENTLKMINDNITGSYIQKRIKERAEIKKALYKDIERNNFKYFNNFIMIGNKTYNGWTKDMVDDIFWEIFKEITKPKPEVNISDFEFED